VFDQVLSRTFIADRGGREVGAECAVFRGPQEQITAHRVGADGEGGAIAVASQAGFNVDGYLRLVDAIINLAVP
jgi:hypothetical protein